MLAKDHSPLPHPSMTKEGRKEAKKMPACAYRSSCEKPQECRAFGYCRDMLSERDAMRAENAKLREALEGVMQHCVTVQGMPDRGKGRTQAQQAAFDCARNALKGQA